MLSLHTGLRRGELLIMEFFEVVFSCGLLRVRKKLVVAAKNFVQLENIALVESA